MYWILCLVALIVMCLLMYFAFECWDGEWMLFPSILLMLGLMIMLIVGSVNYFDSKKLIIEHDALQKTINYVKEDYTDLQSAMLHEQVIEYNRSLANYKYWNNNFIMDSTIPDEIDELEPIK